MIKKKHKNTTLVNLTQFNNKLIYLHDLNAIRKLSGTVPTEKKILQS